VNRGFWGMAQIESKPCKADIPQNNHRADKDIEKKGEDKDAGALMLYFDRRRPA